MPDVDARVSVRGDCCRCSGSRIVVRYGDRALDGPARLESDLRFYGLVLVRQLTRTGSAQSCSRVVRPQREGARRHAREQEAPVRSGCGRIVPALGAAHVYLHARIRHLEASRAVQDHALDRAPGNGRHVRRHVRVLQRNPSSAHTLPVAHGIIPFELEVPERNIRKAELAQMRGIGRCVCVRQDLVISVQERDLAPGLDRRKAVGLEEPSRHRAGRREGNVHGHLRTVRRDHGLRPAVPVI